MPFEEKTCPFCGEKDFDLLGLKNHLIRGWCDVYNNTNPEPEPPKKMIVYNGHEMVEGWDKQIEKAQFFPIVRSSGIEYKRIKYGEEAGDWGADQHHCHDCGVVKGQFHCFGCDVERCPVCKDQIIGCNCLDDEKEPEDTNF